MSIGTINQNDDLELRELRNRLAEITMQLTNLGIDLRKLKRKQQQTQLTIRRLSKIIKQKKMELDKQRLVLSKLEKDAFELLEEEKMLKKKRNRFLAKLRVAEQAQNNIF